MSSRGGNAGAGGPRKAGGAAGRQPTPGAPTRTAASNRKPGSAPARSGRTTAKRRPSKAVYRRRRLAAAVVLLALLTALGLGAWALVDRLTSGSTDDGDVGAATSAPVPTSTPTPTPTPTPTVTAGFVPVACAPGVLEVVGSAATTPFPVGAEVTFSLTITNAGPVPCLVDGGTANVGVVVYSGEDRVWSSVDCPAGATERPLLLDSEALENLTVSWNQLRSAPGCPDGQTTVEPGNYRAMATLDGGVSVVSGWQRAFIIQ